MCYINLKNYLLMSQLWVYFLCKQIMKSICFYLKFIFDFEEYDIFFERGGVSVCFNWYEVLYLQNLLIYKSIIESICMIFIYFDYVLSFVLIFDIFIFCYG